MNCPRCNAQLDGGAYCPYCGQQLSQPQQQSQHVPPDFYNQYKQQNQQPSAEPYTQNNQNWQQAGTEPYTQNTQNWQQAGAEPYTQNTQNWQQPQNSNTNYPPQGGYTQSPYQQPPINVNVYAENNVQNGNPYPQYAASYKSRLVTLLLCVFLGVIGVHRFYAGKIGTGLLWLFTGGLFGIGFVVDIILIATGSFTDQYGYPILYW